MDENGLPELNVVTITDDGVDLHLDCTDGIDEYKRLGILVSATIMSLMTCLGIDDESIEEDD